MQCCDDPYQAPYREIIAIASEDGKEVELIERYDCIGGGMWVAKHYAKSPLVKSVRTVGETVRYMLRTGKEALELMGSVFPAGIADVTVDENEISVSYQGLGGGGVGASICRAKAKGVLRAEVLPSGGGKMSGSTLHLKRMQRIIFGIDDTDTPESGATWSLVHNIAKEVEDENSRYISHTIIQLFPVKQRTKNCVATALEFATTEPEVLIQKVQALVEKYTLSDKTGMVVYHGFDTTPLEEYGWMVKRGEITLNDMENIRPLIDVRIGGSGIIGATAAIPFYTRFDEALELCGKP